jgi:hypothetical protein
MSKACAPKSTPVHLRVPPLVYVRLKAYAKRENRSLSGAVLDLVIRMLAVAEGGR